MLAIPMSMELEEIVQRPTWKEVLLDLIIKEELDPWDVDLVKVSDAYLKKIKEMNKVELYIPANMILASAILLRYKSHILRFEEPSLDTTENVEDIPFEKPSIEPLKPLLRMPPKRPITLSELVGEIDKVIQFQEKREITKKEKLDLILNLKIEGENLEKRMEEIYDMIVKEMDDEEFVLFSKIISKKTEKKDIVFSLLSILHLSQENKIALEQRELFGEIQISLVQEK